MSEARDAPARPAERLLRAPAEACERWAPPAIDADGAPAPGRTWNRPLTAAQLEALQREAYDEAFAEGRAAGAAEGYREGRARAEAEVRPVAERCRALLDALAAPLAALDDEVEQALLAVAFAVARQLVRRELRTAPGEVVAAVREALAALPAAARRVRVYLHPADAGLVREALSLEDDGDARRIVEDPTLTRGGCRVESDASRVDATVEARLAAVVASALGGNREGDAGD